MIGMNSVTNIDFYYNKKLTPSEVSFFKSMFYVITYSVKNRFDNKSDFLIMKKSK